ncbi:MAG: hypothetical protein F6K26_14745 [Moorea sp. SIO2I5]|nr:hypothetical protein [Moorena sp. SIO2I5]
MLVKKIPIKVGWAKLSYLEDSCEPKCFCPPYKLLPYLNKERAPRERSHSTDLITFNLLTFNLQHSAFNHPNPLPSQQRSHL